MGEIGRRNGSTGPTTRRKLARRMADFGEKTARNDNDKGMEGEGRAICADFKDQSMIVESVSSSGPSSFQCVLFSLLSKVMQVSWSFSLLVLTIVSSIVAIPIPNKQIGKAEVECGENFIEVVFITEEAFDGRIFVLGHADEPECQSRETGRKTTTISIKKNACSVTTTRSANPQGLFVNVKVMLSFHESFITKVDRGYDISCFYMEAEKTVTFPLTVSMGSLEPFTELAEMPLCRYEVLDPQTNDPLSVVAVGKPLLHKWTCDSSSPGLWCMTVHSCFVEDGTGTQFAILNDKGCSVDKFLLSNLEYGPGNLMAQKEAHAFKFADKVVVNFQCSVRLDIRDGSCPRPNCPAVRGRSRSRRVFRSVSNTNELDSENNISDFDGPPVADVDVHAQQLDVLDPKLDFGLNIDDERFRSAIEQAAEAVRPYVWRHSKTCSNLTKMTLFVPWGLCLALAMSMLFMIGTLWRTEKRQKS